MEDFGAHLGVNLEGLGLPGRNSPLSRASDILVVSSKRGGGADSCAQALHALVEGLACAHLPMRQVAVTFIMRLCSADRLGEMPIRGRTEHRGEGGPYNRSDNPLWQLIQILALHRMQLRNRAGFLSRPCAACQSGGLSLSDNQALSSR